MLKQVDSTTTPEQSAKGKQQAPNTVSISVYIYSCNKMPPHNVHFAKPLLLIDYADVTPNPTVDDPPDMYPEPDQQGAKTGAPPQTSPEWLLAWTRGCVHKEAPQLKAHRPNVGKGWDVTRVH